MSTQEPHSREQDSTIMRSMTHKPNYQGRRTTTRTAEFILDNGIAGVEVDDNVLWNNQYENIIIHGDGPIPPNDNNVHNNTIPDVNYPAYILFITRFWSAERRKWLTIEFLSRWTM